MLALASVLVVAKQIKHNYHRGAFEERQHWNRSKVFRAEFAGLITYLSHAILNDRFYGMINWEKVIIPDFKLDDF